MSIGHLLIARVSITGLLTGLANCCEETGMPTKSAAVMNMILFMPAFSSFYYSFGGMFHVAAGWCPIPTLFQYLLAGPEFPGSSTGAEVHLSGNDQRIG